MKLPVYIINLPYRKERLENVLPEFSGREEFEINIIAAEKNTTGARGLWLSFQKVIRIAIEKKEEIIIICEDDHLFTKHYNKEYFFKNVMEANNEGCDILMGGVSGNFTKPVVPISFNRFWIDEYWCNQFIVLYKDIFETILNTRIENVSKVDLTISKLSNDKMFLFPFVSIQKVYDYSDVTAKNETDKSWIENRFTYFTDKLEMMRFVHNFYHPHKDA